MFQESNLSQGDPFTYTRLRKCVARRLALTTSVRSFREAQLKRVAALALKLEDQNSQWLEQAPAHVQRVLGAVGPKVFHVAAFISLLKDGQWPDADLLKRSEEHTV